MTIGIDPFGIPPFGVGGGEAGAESAPFDPSTLLNRDIVYLVEAFPWDPVEEAIIRVGFSDPAQQNRKCIFSGFLFPAKLVNTLSVKYRLFQRNLPTEQTEASSLGTITLGWGDGEHDNLTDYYWDGRAINIYIGEPHYEFEQFQRVYTGFVKDVNWNEQFIEFEVEDQLDRLAVPIQENTYAGDGVGESYDANPQLTGTLKPLTWGAARNVELVLINDGFDVYQFNDGPAEAVDAIYDKGNELVKANSGANDITDLAIADVFDWTPVGGQYITDLARGIVRLGAPPIGAVTGDVKGSNDGGYSQLAGELFVRLLTRAGISSALIDTVSADTLDTNFPYVIGFYTSTNTVTYRDLIDQVVHSVFGYWRVDREGIISVARFEFATPALTVHEGDVLAIQREDTHYPIWKLVLNYNRAWMVQDRDGLADGVIPPHRDAVSKEYQKVEQENASIRTAHLKATLYEMFSLLTESADAQDEATSRMALLDELRHFYKVTVKNNSWIVVPGITININWPRWNVSTRDFIVVGVDENVASGNTTLLIWG
jgi:hypothetical protein